MLSGKIARGTPILGFIAFLLTSLLKFAWGGGGGSYVYPHPFPPHPSCASMIVNLKFLSLYIN
jgi:hypothetical protein